MVLFLLQPIGPLPSLSRDTDDISQAEGGDTIPSDPLDLVDYKVKHAAAKESENARIPEPVQKFCRFQ